MIALKRRREKNEPESILVNIHVKYKEIFTHCLSLLFENNDKYNLKNKQGFWDKKKLTNISPFNKTYTNKT